MPGITRNLIIGSLLLCMTGCMNTKGGPNNPLVQQPCPKPLSILVTKQRVTAGEMVDFIVCSDEEGYFTLWSTAPGGQVVRILASRRLRSGIDYGVRGGRVTGRRGKKYVFVVWTKSLDTSSQSGSSCHKEIRADEQQRHLQGTLKQDCRIAQVAIEVIG